MYVKDQNSDFYNKVNKAFKDIKSNAKFDKYSLQRKGGGEFQTSSDDYNNNINKIPPQILSESD